MKLRKKKKIYKQSQILDKLKVYSDVGSKVVKPKPKGYIVFTRHLEKGESLKCVSCRCNVRRSQGHRKVYLVAKKGSTSLWSSLCYQCKESLIGM